MILWILLLVFSVLIIWKGSDWLTDSLIPVANHLGTSYIAVTTLLASFMMSSPELIISIYTYALGHQTLGIGVLIGSVIINIGLTVGISAWIKPLKVEKGIVIRDGLYLITVATVVMVMGSDLSYTRSEGLTLLLLFIPYALNVWFFEKARSHDSRKDKVEMLKKTLDLFGDQVPFLKFKPGLLTFTAGAAMLFLGSYFIAESLINISKHLSISELIIGIVIGAAGTGTPNIAAAIQGTLKGYDDAAITETFGSNIFTLLVILGLLIALSPFTISSKIFYFDMTWMIFIHILMLAFIFKGYSFKEHSLTRLEGFILVVFYIALISVNVLWFR